MTSALFARNDVGKSVVVAPDGLAATRTKLTPSDDCPEVGLRQATRAAEWGIDNGRVHQPARPTLCESPTIRQELMEAN
jgi:hypothetical protein